MCAFALDEDADLEAAIAASLGDDDSAGPSRAHQQQQSLWQQGNKVWNEEGEQQSTIIGRCVCACMFTHVCVCACVFMCVCVCACVRVE